MEITTILGLGIGFVCIVISILIGEGGDVMSFVDLPSVFIVFGGVIASTVASYPLNMIKGLPALIGLSFKKSTVNLQEDIEMIISIANIARREGLLALEDSVRDLDNPFFQKGVMLVVDGADPDLIKTIMEAEIYFVQERHASGQAILNSMSSFSPAYGMIGTLIGLINMLKSLSDSASLGPSMSVALVTTFYGVVLANLIFTPMANKLKLRTADEVSEKELLLEGLLSIQDGENPRIIRDKLNAFISRKDIPSEEQQGLRQESGEAR